MAGLAGYLEGWIAGDKKFGNQMKDQYKYGRGMEAEGDALWREGLAGLNDLDQRYTSALDDRNGPLPESVRNAIRGLYGRNQDAMVRGDRSYRAQLGQLAKQSGGAVSEGAQLEYALENEKNLNEALFEANRDVGLGEAQMTLEETNRLRDRLESVRGAKLGAAERRQASAIARQLASLELRYKRNKAISDAIMSYFGGGGGGGAAGLAGGSTAGGGGGAASAGAGAAGVR